jgi:hypothetical protein
VAILPAVTTLAEKFRDTHAPHTLPESVQPCNRDEIADISLGDNGCTSGCNPVADCAEPVARLQTVANCLATGKPLDSNGKSLPGHGCTVFRGGYEGEVYDAGSASEPPDDALDIPAFLDRRGERCTHCGQPGGSECGYDGINIRLHSDCRRPWTLAYEATRRMAPS